MEKEKTLIIKPPFWFSFQLFLFMMLVIWDFGGLINRLNEYWWDPMSLMPIRHFVITWIIDFIAYAYAYAAIYKALQHKPYSIMMLKFSTIYLFSQFLFHSFDSVQVAIESIPIFFWAITAFYVIFLFYLFRSKRLKTYIPLQQRRFGKYGVWALGIYFMVFVQYLYVWCMFFYKEYKSVPVSQDKIQLQEGEFTDGLVLFKSLGTWKLDSISGNSEDGLVYAFKDRSDNLITAMAFNAVCENRVDYCAILSQIYKMHMSDTIALKEVSYCDSLINGFQFYSNTYEIAGSDTKPLYWTFSGLIPNDCHKMLTLSYFEKGDSKISLQEIKAFLQTVVFDLKERRVVHKSIDKVENGSHNNEFND